MILAILLLAPTFTRDVAPILFKNCVGCHHPGTNTAFSLLTYEDVRPLAKRIAAVTKGRYMPPWKPDAGYGDEFQNARHLTGDEIATIERWVSDGAPKGNPEDLPPPPQWTEGWKLGAPDIVIRMPQPYDVRADGPDVFRNFVLPIPTNELRYVKAIEFNPGTRAVHHANMRIDETPASRQRDEADPSPGYDGLIASTAHYPDGYFLGWTPGQLPPVSPELAWPLNPGSDMVVELHLRPTGRVEHVQVEIGLYFAATPPRLTPAMLRLGKQYIDIPPGEKEYVVTDSYVLPVDVDVHAVQPHAHYRAKKIEGFATLPDGRMKWLLRISDWDFDWQDTYRYVKPASLPIGTTLTMRYTYDNSVSNRRNPQLPPRRVRWGQNSTDEMGDLWIQVVTHTRSDLDLLVREFRQKVFREDILGYESVLAITPSDVALHDDVALLYMAVGNSADAIKHFSVSVRLAPDSAAAHFNLATALTAAGRIDDAITQYQRALQLKPGYALAHNNLGSVLLARGHIDEAGLHLRRAVEIDPALVDAQNNLGKLLEYEGRLEEASEHLHEALRLRPEYPEAHYNIARVFLAQRHAIEAADHYRTALELRPAWAPVLIEAAWLFATHPDEGIRNANDAVSFAERAAVLTKNQDAVSLDVLAAAYAAAGNFEKAIDIARASRGLLTPRDVSAISDIDKRLALYEQRHAYIDGRGSGPICCLKPQSR